jgi:hypothetical protein
MTISHRANCLASRAPRCAAHRSQCLRGPNSGAGAGVLNRGGGPCRTVSSYRPAATWWTNCRRPTSKTQPTCGSCPLPGTTRDPGPVHTPACLLLPSPWKRPPRAPPRSSAARHAANLNGAWASDAESCPSGGHDLVRRVMGRKPDPVAKPHHSGGGGASSPRAARKAPPSPVFLGTALFVLGFVSLFTGHVVTDADWSRIRSRWRSKQVIYLGFPPFYSLIARNFVSAWSLVCGNLIEVRERRLCFWPLDGYTYTCHIAGNNLRKVSDSNLIFSGK